MIVRKNNQVVLSTLIIYIQLLNVSQCIKYCKQTFRTSSNGWPAQTKNYWNCWNMVFKLYIRLWCVLEGFNLFCSDWSFGMWSKVIYMFILHYKPFLVKVYLKSSLLYSIVWSSKERLLVGAVYRSPSSSPDNDQKLFSILSKLPDSVNFTNRKCNVAIIIIIVIYVFNVVFWNKNHVIMMLRWKRERVHDNPGASAS